MKLIESPIIPLDTDVSVCFYDSDEGKFTDYFAGKVVRHLSTNKALVVYKTDSEQDYYDAEATFTYRIGYFLSEGRDYSQPSEWAMDSGDALLAEEVEAGLLA